MTRTKRRTVLVVASLVPIGILVAMGWHRLRCSDQFYRFYPTYALAVAGGAMERGWIPPRVPSGAVEIHGEHNIDTNEVWVRFRVSDPGRLNVVSGMRKLGHDEILSLHTRHPCRADFWYQGIIEQEPENDGALNAEIYVGKSPVSGWLEFVALDRAEPFIYYWNDPKGTSGVAR